MVTPGVELNSNALVVFAVPAPAAGQEALPPLEVKFTVPVLLTVTACCVVVRHGAPSLHRRAIRHLPSVIPLVSARRVPCSVSSSAARSASVNTVVSRQVPTRFIRRAVSPA